MFSSVEKKKKNYLSFLTPGRSGDAVMTAMRMLKEECGNHFGLIFKTITVDNGSEFADFAQCEEKGTEVYFAHPFASWERPQNERHNGLFRTFVPKCTSMENYSAEYILSAADELNARPRRKLGYRTPEELFDAFLDRIYAVGSKLACLCQGKLRLACGILDSASRACCVIVKAGLCRTNFYHAGVQLALAIFGKNL